MRDLEQNNIKINNMIIENKFGIRFHTALEAKYKAEIAEAEATLELYFNNMVGIGEHSELMVELDKWVEKLANAKDKLEIIKNISIGTIIKRS